MAKKKNQYAQKAEQKALTGTAKAASSSTKGSIGNSAAELGKDILIGVIGGSAAGAVAGKSSLLIGIIVSGAGHYMGSRAISLLGVGMMASGGYQLASSGVNGTPANGLDGIKERLLALKENFKDRLFLDKIIKSKQPKAEGETTSGLGEVQYFVYPGSDELSGESDLQALEKIERQLEQSASSFSQNNGMEYKDISGLSGELSDVGDISDLNI